MLRKLVLLTVLTAVVLAQGELIEPGQGIGPVRRSMMRPDLDRVAPPEALFDGNTDHWPSTTLWAMDPDRRITIFWGPQGSILRLLVGGRPPTVYKTREGITLGTSARELEKLNGEPFVMSTFSGKRWGEVLDWQGGALQKALPGVTLALTMNVPGYGPLTGEQKEALEKPGRLESSDPLIRALNPQVERIELKF